MKISKSLGMLLTLICLTVIVVTTFRLSPSFARSTPVMSAQESPEKVTTDLIAQGASGRSLYTKLGGYNGIAKVIDDSAAIIFADPVIGKYFIGLGTNSKQRLRQLLVDQFCQAAGGPCVYTGRTMTLSHSGMDGGLGDNEFNAFANAVSQALTQNSVNPLPKAEVMAFVESLRDKIVEN
ncbi:group 1 truncated hemoglobin [Microcoleus sp. AR_TQ3_B6]|uniref:group 1 truncated hemoglobin n=1 Tax=Microcoleus sp. AR_TQ3_B6 TaxID=3055284 RepID=UPI002FCFAF6B